MSLIRKRENHDTGVTRPTWNPFEMMQEMMRWDPFQGLGALSATSTSFMPSFDVKETDEAIVLKADMPGVKEEDLDVSLAGTQLTISGERKEEQRQEGDKHHLYECSYGSFTRAFRVPESIDADNIQAELKNGVLTVQLPKKPEQRPKRIRLFGGKGEAPDA